MQDKRPEFSCRAFSGQRAPESALFVSAATGRGQKYLLDFSGNRLPQYGSPFLRRCAARIAQVDLVVLAAACLSLCFNERMQSLNGGAFFGKRAYVKDMCGRAFVKWLEM